MNVFEIVTQKVVEKLEAGVVPWIRPWRSGIGQPCNLVSGKPYRGINPILLGDSYMSRYWLTFNQIRSLGGYIKEGERASMVVFFKPIENRRKQTVVEDATNEDSESKKSLPFVLRYYNVWNAAQVEGICHHRLEDELINLENLSEFNQIENCESVWRGYKNAPKLQHFQQRAFYRASMDLINMPQKKSFSSEAEYYSTLFHEAIHSTGHESRLNRKSVGNSYFGSEAYSKEELIAEMGAAMLCAHSGIDSMVIDNSAAYIDSWLGALKQPKNYRLVVDAASAAQKAVDHIIMNADGNEDDRVGE